MSGKELIFATVIRNKTHLKNKFEKLIVIPITLMYNRQ